MPSKYIVRVTMKTDGKTTKKAVRQYVQDSLDMRADDSVGGKGVVVLSAKASTVDEQ